MQTLQTCKELAKKPLAACLMALNTTECHHDHCLCGSIGEGIMNTTTYIALTRDELVHICEQSAIKAVALAAKNSGELWTCKEVADHLRVHPRTIGNRVKRGLFPQPVNGLWKRHEVMAITV
jgi:hypothetical protein